MVSLLALTLCLRSNVVSVVAVKQLPPETLVAFIKNFSGHLEKDHDHPKEFWRDKVYSNIEKKKFQNSTNSTIFNDTAIESSVYFTGKLT